MTNTVSVITIVKDHEKGLFSTLNSLLAQDYVNWESIVVIGDSKDQTYEVACEFADQDSRIKIVRQADKGIYQAMNLGTQIALGEYVWYMNAGDTFYDNESISIGLNAIKKFNCDLVIGGYGVQGRIPAEEYSFPEKKLNFGIIARSRRGTCHQSMIFTANVVREFNGYNPNFKFAADYDLILRLINTSTVMRIPQVISSIEPGGVSDVNLRKVHREKLDIRNSILTSRFHKILSMGLYLLITLWLNIRKIKS
jgi:glycosyltransferase involved in cell wall biosynthesis